MSRRTHTEQRLAVVCCLLLGAGCGGSDGTGPKPIAQPLPVATVVVTPGVDTVVAADSCPLIATPQDSGGHALTHRSVSWSTSNASVATVSAAGYVHGQALGVATITATVEGRTATATITVAPVITVLPDLPSLFAGDTLQLRSVLTDATGATLPGGGTVAWTSGVPATASVSSSGIVSAHAAGIVTVTASVAGATGTVDVVVLSSALRANREIGFINRDSTGYQVRMVSPSDSTWTSLTANLLSITEFAWSSDGSKVAATYLGNTQPSQPRTGVWVHDASGGGEHQLTVSGTSPTWAPDGSRVAFVVSVAGDLEIYSNTAAGTDLRRLTNRSGRDYQPTWSPDGRRIAYMRDAGELWLMRADGSGAQRLVNTVPGIGWPRWSPDGKRLAFRAGYVVGGSDWGIWIVNADGSGLAAVSANCTGTICLPGAGGPEVSPTWSHDARYLYYPTPVGQISRVQLSGPAWLTFPGSCGGVVEVSPDDQLLAVYCPDSSQTPNWASVFVVPATGGARRRLTTGPGGENSHQQWRP